MRRGRLVWWLVCLAVLSFLTAAVAEPLRLDVREASVGSDERTAAPILTIRLADGMREAWRRFTTENLARRIELRIDGETVLTSVIREVMPVASFRMSGHSADEVRAVAERLSKPGKVEVEAASRP
jgi:preprotein translocase subunit SecD